MTNDARSKLRSMGGIMASSPELMQVAQKFQVGGRVSAGASPLRTIPTVRQPEMPELGPRNPGYDPKIFRSGTIDPVLSGTRRVAPLSPTQARRNVALELGAMDSPTYGGGAQPFPSTPRLPSDMRVPPGPEGGRPDLAVDRIISDLIAGDISSAEQEEITVDDLLDVSISRGIPIQELVDMMPEGVKSKVEASVEQRMGERLPVPTIGDRVSPLAPRRRPSIVGRDVESLEGPEATGLGGQMRPTREMIDEDNVMSQGIPRQALGLSEDDEAMPPMIADDPEGTADEALSSLDKSYEEKLALFNKVFGDSDEQDSKDKAMNLAMIGLAIAAGQSPNALTNIAQGLMVGAKGIGAQRKERQAKREKTKLLALDAALKEEAAQQEFARELDLKDMEAGNKSDYDELKQIETPFGKIWARMPTANAMEQGVSPLLVQPELVDSLYKTSIAERDRVMGNIDRAAQLLSESGDEIVGGKASALRTFKKLNSLGFVPDTIYKTLTGDDETLSSFTEYDVIMNNLASELAPILLGESGRTISDGDRALVARQLGFAVDQSTVNGYDGISITGFVGTGIKSEEGLKASLDAIKSRLGTHYAGLDASYKSIRPKAWNDMQKEAKPSKSNVRKFDAQGNPIQ